MHVCGDKTEKAVHTGSGHTVEDKDVHPDAALQPCPGLLTEETGTQGL